MSPFLINMSNRQKIKIFDAREYVPPSEISVSNNGHLTIHYDYFSIISTEYVTFVYPLIFKSV